MTLSPLAPPPSSSSPRVASGARCASCRLYTAGSGGEGTCSRWDRVVGEAWSRCAAYEPARLVPFNRCGACAWWSRQTAEIGLCETSDLTTRVDAVGCPSWRRALDVVRRTDA